MSQILFVLLFVVPAAAEDVYLPPVSFVPAASTSVYSFDQGGLGCLRLHQGTGFFVAALPAPNGAVIEQMTALVEDVNADAVAMLTLARRRPTSFEVIAMTPPSQGAGQVESLVVQPAPSVNVADGETYLLQLLLSGPEVCFHGASVRMRSAAP